MAEPKDIKTPLSNGDLEHFKALLLEKREEAQEKLDTVWDDQTNLEEADDADYSSLTHHLGDVGSDVQEEEMHYQLIERLREYIQYINEALERIENKTYGICLATGKLISKERLEAVPHTRYSIEAKNKGLVEDT